MFARLYSARTLREFVRVVQKTRHDFSTPRWGGSRVDRGWLVGWPKRGLLWLCVAFDNVPKCPQMRPQLLRFGAVRSQNRRETKRGGEWGGGGWVIKCKKWIEKWLWVDADATKQGGDLRVSRKPTAFLWFDEEHSRAPMPPTRIDIHTYTHVVINICIRLDIYTCRFALQMSIGSSQHRLRDPQSRHVRANAASQ